MNNFNFRIAIVVSTLVLSSAALATTAEAQTSAAGGASRNVRLIASNVQSAEHRWTNNVSRNFYGQ